MIVRLVPWALRLNAVREIMLNIQVRIIPLKITVMLLYLLINPVRTFHNLLSFRI